MKYSRLQNVYLQQSGLSKEGYSKYPSPLTKEYLENATANQLVSHLNHLLFNIRGGNGVIVPVIEGSPRSNDINKIRTEQEKRRSASRVALSGYGSVYDHQMKNIYMPTTPPKPIRSCEDHFPSNTPALERWNTKKKFCQLYQKNVTDNNNFKSYLSDAHFLTKEEIDKISIQRDGYGNIMYHFDGKSTGVAHGNPDTPCEQIREHRYCTKDGNKHGDARQQYQDVFRSIKNGGIHPELDQIQTDLDPLLNQVKILNELARKDNNIKKIQRCNFKCYLDNYPDLKRAFGNNTDRAMRHYINNGIREGRNCNCKSS